MSLPLRKTLQCSRVVRRSCSSCPSCGRVHLPVVTVTSFQDPSPFGTKGCASRRPASGKRQVHLVSTAGVELSPAQDETQIEGWWLVVGSRRFPGEVYAFPVATTTSDHKPGGLKQQNVLPLCSGGWRAEVECRQAWFFPGV